MRLSNYLNESITIGQLRDLEKVLDALFASANIDIEFTKHFFDRVNDARNKKDITIPELQAIFRKAYARYASELESYGSGFQAVLADLQTNINIPFVLHWNPKSKLIELISKTVMRKKGFTAKKRLPV